MADLEQFAVGWGLQNYNSEEPCFLCTANRSNQPWTSLTDWPPRVGGLPDHPFFSLKGVCRSSLCIDMMHVCDLGIAGVLAGGCLKYLLCQTQTTVDQVRALVQTGRQHLHTKERLDYLGPGTFLVDSRHPKNDDWPVWRP